eukprot:1143654-Pelagomonas_calceolata.AAC.1
MAASPYRRTPRSPLRMSAHPRAASLRKGILSLNHLSAVKPGCEGGKRGMSLALLTADASVGGEDWV